jgi:hypothetical protein
MVRNTIQRMIQGGYHFIGCILASIFNDIPRVEKRSSYWEQPLLFLWNLRIPLSVKPSALGNESSWSIWSDKVPTTQLRDYRDVFGESKPRHEKENLVRVGAASERQDTDTCSSGTPHRSPISTEKPVRSRYTDCAKRLQGGKYQRLVPVGNCIMDKGKKQVYSAYQDDFRCSLLDSISKEVRRFPCPVRLSILGAYLSPKESKTFPPSFAAQSLFSSA